MFQTMTSSIIMNIKSDAFRFGESRNQPFIVWLQLMNFVMLSIVCWVFLKIYRSFLSLFEWIFPFQCNKFHKPVILVMGDKYDLNDEIVRQLSELFHSRVTQIMLDANENDFSPAEVREERKESRIIYVQKMSVNQEAVARLAAHIRKTYGEIDLLFISQNEESAVGSEETHAFLNNLNRQLLTQFWIVMAFLPRMLHRNSGHIVSLALGKTSSLANTGIIRSVSEELILSDTDVKLKLLERNSFVENHLPPLPSDLLARLIIRSIWSSSAFISVPTISQYILLLPLLITRSILHAVIRISNAVKNHSK